MSLTDDCEPAIGYDEMVDLLTSVQIGLLRRCHPTDETLYAVMMLGWKNSDGATPDLLWSFRAPESASRTRCIEMVKEAIRTLQHAVDGWEKQG